MYGYSTQKMPIHAGTTMLVLVKGDPKMKTFLISTLLVLTIPLIAQNSINRTINLTLGSMDKLPPGAIISFKVHTSAGELDPSRQVGRNEFTKEDISSRDLATGDLSYSEIVQEDGFLPSKSFPIDIGKVKPSSQGGKKSIILFDVDISVSHNGSIVFEKKSILPFLIQAIHRDNIPVCISVFHRVVPSGQMSWGISRHSCEQALDLDKKKSFKK